MKTLKTIIACCCLSTSVTLFAQHQSDEVATDVDRYVDTVIASTFEKDLTEENRKDYKKLRDFHQKKTDLLKALTELKMDYDNPHYYSKQIKRFKDKKARIDNAIANAKAAGKTEVDFEPVFSEFNDFAFVSPPAISSERIMPKKIPVSELKIQLEGFSEKIKNLESELKESKTIGINIENVSMDITKCNNELDSTLAPEYQEQNFRIMISISFIFLIATLLISFFLIVYKRSDNTLSKDLLGGNGLQFVTLFVLIIAIILFGILNILKGTELATILSGISGYILGKGIDKAGNESSVTPPVNPNAPVGGKNVSAAGALGSEGA